MQCVAEKEGRLLFKYQVFLHKRGVYYKGTPSNYKLEGDVLRKDEEKAREHRCLCDRSFLQNPTTREARDEAYLK
jgi:hypothetical protein